MAGIGINDPHNGIWLINFVKNKALFMNKLRNVKIAIRTGTLPSKIFEKIDKQWKGI